MSCACCFFGEEGISLIRWERQKEYARFRHDKTENLCSALWNTFRLWTEEAWLWFLPGPAWFCSSLVMFWCAACFLPCIVLSVSSSFALSLSRKWLWPLSVQDWGTHLTALHFPVSTLELVVRITNVYFTSSFFVKWLFRAWRTKGTQSWNTAKHPAKCLCPRQFEKKSAQKEQEQIHVWRYKVVGPRNGSS